jgi:hypothetical protein
MTDQEKFEGFKQNLIDENEKNFGQEVRAKYGKDALDASHAKIKGLSKEAYEELSTLSQELHEALAAAVAQGDPASELAQKAATLHKRWLCYYWPTYSKEAHIGVSTIYVTDPRFTAYYENIAPGCAVFLRDAIAIFCEKE